MYRRARYTGAALAPNASDPPPFGPGFAATEIAQAHALEVWCTSFDDPGPDFVVFKLLDANERSIAERHVAGY